MATNKVVYGNTTLIDLTGDTATQEDVMQGKTFHDKSGVKKTGTATPGSAYEMLPTPSASLNESTVVQTIQGATGANDNVPSLFSVQQWTNVKKRRIIYTGNIGSTGIGEWQGKQETQPTAQQEAGWGWWQNNAFILPSGMSSDDIDFKIKYDPSTGESIDCGGYQWDTDTGYVCIKFAKEISDTENARIAVDMEYIRTDISYDNA